jgi:hypothetical protein
MDQIGVMQVQYHDITDSANLGTWRGMSYQTVLTPADQKTGDIIYPHVKASDKIPRRPVIGPSEGPRLARGRVMETLPRFGISRTDMMKRVALFNELNGSDGGLPDSKAPQCQRVLYNVIGFQPPKDSGGAVTSPVGDDASRLAAIPISEGFNLGYCRAKPGKGPMMHNHDTN